VETIKDSLLKEVFLQFIEFGDNIIGAIVILLIGLILVRVITRFIRKVLSKAGVDKLADRYLNDIDFLSSNNIRIVPSGLFSKILYYFLILVVLVAATDVLQMQAVSDLVKSAVDYVPSLLIAFVLLIIGLFLADLVKNVSLTAFQSLNIPAGKFISSFLFYFILLNIFMLALEQAKINTAFISSNLSIILGGVVFAFAIGYGLASRSLMSNYIAHFYNSNNVSIGDTIIIDNKEGVIKEMSNTTMSILTKDGSEVIVPLSHLNTEIIEVVKRKSKSPSEPPV